MAAFPSWWADGAEVMHSSGATGSVSALQEGYEVIFTSGKIDSSPNPTSYQQINANLGISEQQVRRICYDLERAILVAAGRGGGTQDWSYLPEARTSTHGPVHPKPLGTDQLSNVRRDCVSAVIEALKPYRV